MDKKIVLNKEEVDNMAKKLYKRYKHKIYDMPIQSIITEPYSNDNVYIKNNMEYINCKGIAWTGGGRGIIKVEVSIDNGNTWYEANIDNNSQKEIKYQRNWDWILWNVKIPIKYMDKDCNKLKIMCRAIDTSFNSQPKDIEDIISNSMYVNNSYRKFMLIL